jgi:WD40 repeat protein
MDDDVIIPVGYNEIEYPDNYESYGTSGTEKDEKDNSDSYSITEQYDRCVPDKINESYGISYTEQDDKPHNDKPITNIEISPNGKYLVTYSKEDCSIIGWDISGTGDTDIRRLEPDSIVETGSKRVNQICISDDRKLAYIYNDSKFIGKQ